MLASVMGQRLKTVGHNPARTEGWDKLTGRARYIDDYVVPGMIWGATVRSTVPHARIVEVTRDPEFDWSGFTVVTHRDIPSSGKNVVAMITDDQPFLAVERTLHQAEPLMLLAHADRARLEEGLRHVQVDYAPEPAVLELDRATTVLKQITIEKGDVARGLAEAELVVEGTYRTGAQEQLYIEPNGVIALPEADGGITVMGSLQCPYYVLRALEGLFGLPREKVRVIQTTTGGGFGGKEEYPSLIAGHAALLARKAGVPVKMIYGRHEDMVATTKRHPSRVRHRTGVLRDGTLVAAEIEVVLDGGAYVTLSPVVLSRACIHAAGPYRIPHVRIDGRVMQTHTPPNGAFRGFGAPQSQFASEAHMDRIAEALGMDPVALRRKNLLRVGDETATGQVLKASVSAEEALDRALARHEKFVKRKKSRANGDSVKRGRGVALFFHGSGFTGGGEAKLASKAGLALRKEGVEILVASTEIGQGTRTMLAQIVAETLGLPYERVITGDPDTARVPDSGPTVASRTCMIVGGILQRAAAQLKERLGGWESVAEFDKKARRFLKEHGALTIIEEYEHPKTIVWSDETYRGDAYQAYAWGANVAEVEVDPVTYQARCTHLTAAIDVGKAIHPILVEGQIEGGSLQAVGWALYEDVVMRDGKMANASLTNYIIPTTLDTPHIAVEVLENPHEGGPFGAKGVGECPVDGPAAAIVNGLRQALGVRVDEIPATPERIMRVLSR
jgi:CO/xanthine dehydrogenase Mo-binding subunit